MLKGNIQSLLYNFFVLRNEPAADFENRLFKLITLPNGTTKNTSAHRLDELNIFTLPFLSEISSPVIKDVAVSSGISTLEWLQQLQENNLKAKITATDLYVNANLIQWQSSFSILCDHQFNPLLVEFGKSLFRTSFPKGSLRFRWGKLFSKAIKAIFIGKKSMEINEHSIGDKCIVFPVHLLTAGQDRMAAIDFSEEDIFLPPENFEIDKYDVVRAANILNKVYFSNADLAQILSNLFSQLKTGGMLIVCKTDDTGRNHASLFVKEEYRFALLKNLNEGSEVENIVLQFSRKK